MQEWDRDYGLEPGERFEPDELEEVFDLGEPHIRTLLGVMAPGALGMTVWCRELSDLVAGEGDDPGTLLAELEAAHYMGLRGLGLILADVSEEWEIKLRWIAERCPVHVVLPDSAAALDFVWWSDASETSHGGYVIVDDLFDDEPSSLARLAVVPAAQILVGMPTPRDGDDHRTLTDLLHRAPLALMNAGYQATDVRMIFVDNPATALSQMQGNENDRKGAS